MDTIEKILKRPTREDTQLSLIDIEPDWKTEWWGMPEFTMGDATPQYRITINFLTKEDKDEFSQRAGIPLSEKTDSAWYPPQRPLAPGNIEYYGITSPNRYPICILSKGRPERQMTANALDKMGLSYKVFVENIEAESYLKSFKGQDEKIEIMPFNNLGQGGIPARNYIWDWAKQRGHKRHWILDDNIVSFARCNNNRRLRVRGGNFFQSMEDFVDRYENIAMAGPHHMGFVMDRSANIKPFILNTRIYSCILIDTSIPYRWRGKYNEDTDLSIRVLKDGYCTVLFQALLMDKFGTTIGDGTNKNTRGGKDIGGGNSTNVYNKGDYRLAFANSLKEQHPDVVKVVWKFNRWHHQVDYSYFKNNKLIRKQGITPTLCNNEYGMKLVRIENDKRTET